MHKRQGMTVAAVVAQVSPNMDNRFAIRNYGDRSIPATAVAQSEAKRRRRMNAYLSEHVRQHGADTMEGYPLVPELIQWCRQGSIRVCSVCSGLETTVLNQHDLVYPDETDITCTVCLRGHYIRPEWNHVPAELRSLTRAQVECLAPLSIHQGDMVRSAQGYRQYSRMTRLRWKRESFDERVAALPEELQADTIAAHDFLMACVDSAYGDFERRQIDSAGQWTHMQFLQEKWVENALWPDLYPFETWRDSIFIGSESKYRSAKTSFVAKAYSAVLDYAADSRLAQFVYDRAW